MTTHLRVCPPRGSAKPIKEVTTHAAPRQFTCEIGDNCIRMATTSFGGMRGCMACAAAMRRDPVVRAEMGRLRVESEAAIDAATVQSDAKVVADLEAKEVHFNNKGRQQRQRKTIAAPLPEPLRDVTPLRVVPLKPAERAHHKQGSTEKKPLVVAPFTVAPDHADHPERCRRGGCVRPGNKARGLCDSCYSIACHRRIINDVGAPIVSYQQRVAKQQAAKADKVNL